MLQLSTFQKEKINYLYPCSSGIVNSSCPLNIFFLFDSILVWKHVVGIYIYNSLEVAIERVGFVFRQVGSSKFDQKYLSGHGSGSGRFGHGSGLGRFNHESGSGRFGPGRVGSGFRSNTIGFFGSRVISDRVGSGFGFL
jgi:hypothetical protein